MPREVSYDRRQGRGGGRRFGSPLERLTSEYDISSTHWIGDVHGLHGGLVGANGGTWFTGVDSLSDGISCVNSSPCDNDNGDTAKYSESRSSDTEAPLELLELVVKGLMSRDQEEAMEAAADMEILDSSSQPCSELRLGKWRWTASGAAQNRIAFGGVRGIWDSLLNIVRTGNSEGKAKVCGALSKLGFRNTHNVLNIMRYPRMLDALTKLLDEDKNCKKVVVQAWCALQNC